MKVLFYRREGAPTSAPPLPPGVEIRVWRPRQQGLPPRGPHWSRNLAWWLFDATGLFANREFTEVCLWRDGRLLHRLIVTPGWWRFPFMARDDLQLGDLWTAPDARRQGLALIAMGEAHQRLAARGAQQWYLTQEDNPASISLAERGGYRLAARGRRTRPLGIGLFGRFRIDAEI